jgi:hypothetical protein
MGDMAMERPYPGIDNTVPLKLPLGQKFPHHARPKENEKITELIMQMKERNISTGDVQPNTRINATKTHENPCIKLTITSASHDPPVYGAAFCFSSTL